MNHDRAFAAFMQNVEYTSELIRELASSDDVVQRNAIEKADLYLTTLEDDAPCRDKFNKTKINSTLPNMGSMTTQTNPNMSQGIYMNAIEKDAKERLVRRKAGEIKATAFKDKGNDAYARQDYEMAVKCYSDGLAEIRDMLPLYTNRAQAYIKLGRYSKAVSDCEMALRCDEKCIKAYLHMGKAYLALGDYRQSRNCFEKIVEIEPGKEKMIKEYLTQVDLAEEGTSASDGETVSTVTHPVEKLSSLT